MCSLQEVSSLGSGHGSPVSYLDPEPQSPLLSTDLLRSVGPDYTALGACTLLCRLPLLAMLVKITVEAGAFASGAEAACKWDSELFAYLEEASGI